MDGQTFKNRIKALGIKVTDLADKLEMSQQNLSAVFNTKDVKSGILEKTAAVLGITIAEIYGEPKEIHTIIQDSTNVAAGHGASAVMDGSNVLELVKQITELTRHTTELQKQNADLFQQLLDKSANQD